MPPLPPLDVLPRPAMPGEFVPDHYFKRLAPAAVAHAGRPLEIDLGCGDGGFLLQMAKYFPERDFLGTERLLGRVRKVAKRIHRQGLANARVLRLESRYAVEWLLPFASVSRFHLLCPDPWPKQRHHRRRLVEPRFLEAIKNCLVPGGEFFFMTDDQPYFDWAVQKIEAFPRLERVPWPDDSEFYPKTDFQIQWEEGGRTMHRIRARLNGEF